MESLNDKAHFEETEGEPESFAAYSARIRPALLSFFRRRTFDYGIAEELTQEVFLRLLRKQDLLHLDNTAGYVFEVAANIARDHARRNKVRQVANQIGLDSVELHDPKPLQDVTLAGRMRLQLLLAAVQTLPRRTQVILMLARFEGLSHKDIAKKLGISVSSVEKHLVKALILLRNGAVE